MCYMAESFCMCHKAQSVCICYKAEKCFSWSDFLSVIRKSYFVCFIWWCHFLCVIFLIRRNNFLGV